MTEKPVIGPTLPPGLKKDDLVSLAMPSVEDSYGPPLPPSMLSSQADSHDKGISVAENRMSEDSSPDSGSDDEVIGPLPSDASKSGLDQAREGVERRAFHMHQKLTCEKEEKPEREAWMLELPEEKAKAFGLGPRVFSRKTDVQVSKDRSAWTDTPSDRARKSLEGGKKKTKHDKKYFEEKRAAIRDAKLEELIEKHGKKKKKKKEKSLMEMHEESLKKKKKKDKNGKEKKPERREFDRDVDLKISKMDEAARRSFVKKSQELNSRFGGGSQKYL